MGISIRSRVGRFTTAAVAVATAASVAVVCNVSGAGAATLPTPDNDPFYAAPANIAGYHNGDIIRTRSVDITFSGISLPIKTWQILYRSTDAKDQPVADLTTLAVPNASYQGVRPIVSYQAAEDSVGTQCAPSYALRSNSNPSIVADGTGITQILLKGWAAAIPDYEGSQSEFMAGRQSGHAVLDGVLAVQNFSASGLSAKNPVALWGYSGGGAATAWAAELQPTYAPQLSLAGVSEGGVPADVGAVVSTIDGTLWAGFEFAGIIGLARAYPEMNIAAQVNSAGAAMLQKLGSACEIDILSQLAFKKINDFTTAQNLIKLPLYQGVIAQNNLGGGIPAAPIFDYHAVNDEIIPVGPTDTLMTKYCSEGVKVVKERFAVGDHVTGFVQGFSDAVSFLSDRFAGKPVKTTC